MLAHQQTRADFPAPTPAPVLTAWKSGSYQSDTGSDGNSVTGHNTFGAWRGRNDRMINTFCTGGAWSNITADSNFSRYTSTPYGDSAVMFTLALFPTAKDASGNPVYTLAQAANNDPANPGVNYDANYYAIGQQLVKWNHVDSYVRIGWEFNGNWEVWFATDNATDAANYRTGFQRMVTQLRAAGWHGKVVFCPARGKQNGTLGPDACYPGDNYVDCIGPDSYDRGYANQTPQQRWNLHLTDTGYGLTFWGQFCQAGAGRLDNSSGAGTATTATASKTFIFPDGA